MKDTMLRVISVTLLILGGSVADHEIFCTREGPLCKDCDHRGYCDLTGGSLVYNKDKEEKCVAGWACDELVLACVRKGTCRYKPDICPENQFTEETIFPDPYSCNAYVGCQGSDSNYYPCTGTAYDPVSKKCTAKMTDPECFDYPALCEEVGQVLKISNYSYECVNETTDKGMNLVYPKLVYADSSTTENSAETTTDQSSSGSNPSSTASGDQTDTTTDMSSSGSSADTSTEPANSTVTTQTSTSTTTEKPFECTEEGYFKDKEDCTKFYMCIKKGNSFEKRHLTCRTGSHFDEGQKRCVPGACTTDA